MPNLFEVVFDYQIIYSFDGKLVTTLPYKTSNFEKQGNRNGGGGEIKGAQ